MSFNFDAKPAVSGFIKEAGFFDVVLQKVTFKENRWNQPILQFVFTSVKEYDNVLHGEDYKEVYPNHRVLEIDHQLTYNNKWGEDWGMIESNLYANLSTDFDNKDAFKEAVGDRSLSMDSEGATVMAEALTTVFGGKAMQVAVKAKEWNSEGGVNISFGSVRPLSYRFIGKDLSDVKAKREALIASGTDPLYTPMKKPSTTHTSNAEVDVNSLDFS